MDFKFVLLRICVDAGNGTSFFPRVSQLILSRTTVMNFSVSRKVNCHLKLEHFQSRDIFRRFFARQAHLFTLSSDITDQQNDSSVALEMKFPRQTLIILFTA